MNEETFALPLPERQDLAAATPVPERIYTKKEIGQMRRRYVTVQNSTVVTCGHKFKTDGSTPSTNCDDCWHAFFKVNPELIERIHNILRTSGAGVLMASMGRKFVKKFMRYLEAELVIPEGVTLEGVDEPTAIEQTNPVITQEETCTTPAQETLAGTDSPAKQ
jgi:hypothetical protein